MSDMSMQTSSHIHSHIDHERRTCQAKRTCVCPPEQKTRLARIHAAKSGGANAYLQYKRNGMLVDAEEEVTVESNSPGSLLMERDMMGWCWCMWTALPPWPFTSPPGGRGPAGLSPSTLQWCSSNFLSFSLSFALSNA